MKKRILIIFAVLSAIAILGIISVFGINSFIKNSTTDRIITAEKALEIGDADCIIVLGCRVHSSGTPSAMLRDRLECGIELYNMGVSPKILMSGDHGQKEYDEVNTMKQYAIDAGVSSEDVFMDHAGFSTYESMYRAKEIFEAEKVVIVTQEYHLHRALYIAYKLGLDAYGVSADVRTYAGQSGRELREILARCKDFVTALFKTKPTYLGETIPISGDGNSTND